MAGQSITCNKYSSGNGDYVYGYAYVDSAGNVYTRVSSPSFGDSGWVAGKTAIVNSGMRAEASIGGLTAFIGYDGCSVAWS